MPHDAVNSAQRELVFKHGSPRMFAQACINAIGEISCLEAHMAIAKYKKEWEAAARSTGCFIVALFLSCCVNYHDMYNNKYTSVGGDADVTFPGGGHMTHSHTASFQHFTQMVTTVAGSIAVSAVSKAKTASDNLAATTQAKNASDAATANAKISADAAAAAQKGANQAAHFQTAAQSGLFTPVPLPTPK